MTKHRSYSAAFKRQVAEEFMAGETLHALPQRHDISRQLIRICPRAPGQMGESRDIRVAMDWTEFDHDGQSTLALRQVTGHGRAAPLIWLTVWKDEIGTRRNDYEDARRRRLTETLPAGCRVTILAGRGFGDLKLFGFLAELGFGRVIRFRGDIGVTTADGGSGHAKEWFRRGGHARNLRQARVTAQRR